jgi:hypothetical protein
LMVLEDWRLDFAGCPTQSKGARRVVLAACLVNDKIDSLGAS